MTVQKTFKPSMTYAEFVQLMQRYEDERKKGKKFNNPYRYKRVFDKEKKK